MCLVIGAGLCGHSEGLVVTIQPEDEVDWMPCILQCGDPDCREWTDVWTDPDPDGIRWPLYHIPECLMRDEGIS